MQKKREEKANIDKICKKREKKKQASIKYAKNKRRTSPPSSIIMHAGEITDLSEVLFKF